MAEQLTVRLPEDLSMALRSAAKRMQRKSSEIVRIALREYLQAPLEARDADRIRGLLGSVDSKIPDLADQHRAYILDSLKHGR